MQKLLCALVASTVSAGELFLSQKPALDKDLINTALDIDVNTDSLLPCQYVTATSIFNFLDPEDKLNQEQLLSQTFANGNEVAFNLCEKTFAASSVSAFDGGKCTASDSTAFVYDSTASTCSTLNTDVENTVTDTAGVEIMDSDGSVTGITLMFNGGSCGTGNYKLNVTSMCNKETAAVTDFYVNGTCDYTVVYDSPYGCPVFSLSQVSRFFYKYSYLFGAVLIVAGAFLAFFGNKFVNIVIFMVASFAVLIIGSALFINLALDKVSEEWVIWVSFIVIALIAAGVGALLVKFRKYGIALFAGWGGVMLGFVVTTTFAVGNQYAFWAIIIAAGLGMFFVAIKVEKTVIIMLTAFIGAYAFVRGISLYAGGFPSEMEFHEELETGVVTWETMPKSYYGYLAGILILFIISTVYQSKNNKAREKNRAELKTFMK